MIFKLASKTKRLTPSKNSERHTQVSPQGAWRPAYRSSHMPHGLRGLALGGADEGLRNERSAGLVARAAKRAHSSLVRWQFEEGHQGDSLNQHF